MTHVSLYIPLILASLVLASCSPSPPQSGEEKPPPPSPAIARVGDSVFTLDRLQALLDESERTVPRAEIEARLMEWIEAQVYIAEAVRLGALQDPGFRQDLEEVRQRLFRGFVQAQLLDQDPRFSESEIRAWLRANPERARLEEEQIRLKWFTAEDSTRAASLRRAVRANRIRRDQLAEEGVGHGESDWLERRDLEADLVEALFALEYLEVSPLLPREDGWAFYQLTGRRPVGYRLGVNEAEVVGMMREEARRKALADGEAALLAQSSWEIDLEPFFDADSLLDGRN